MLRRVAVPFSLVAALGAACAASDDAPNVPTRACGLTVWHEPATAEAHVEIVGDWNDWKRPGVEPERRDDGWRVAALDLPAGEHAYAIVEDGVWLADRNVPMTDEHDGKEVSFVVTPDCEAPKVSVANVVATGDSARIEGSFVAGRAGSPIAGDSIVTAGPAARVVAVDATKGTFALETSGLSRGKYTLSIRAKDRAGRDAEDAVATIWIGDPEPRDPRDYVIYQVMVDRFRGPNGAALAPPETPAERAGGTLTGVTHAITSGAFEAMGVNTIWVSPLYANPEGEFPGNDGRMYSSYHGYWPTASRALDPRVASDADLDTFMNEAHARGIRVLFDVVPNHVHSDHVWTREHPDWFKPDCVCGQGTCDWGTHIKTCWFAPYLPDLDWTNHDAARAQTAEVMWWFDRWGADGLRIDAVPMMPRSATRRIVNAVRTRWQHPGHVPYVLGENFTGPGGYQSLRYDLGPFGLDGSFHFPLMWTLRGALADESLPMSEIGTSFRAGEEAWNGANAVMGMMIDNHDVSRFASVAAGNAAGDAWTPAPQPLDPNVYARARVALATILTLPGAPVIYYGDEVGLAGKSDPDCRRVMPAESDLSDTQRALRDVVSRIGRARACSKALRRGTLVDIGAEKERIVYAREGDAGDVAIVALSRHPSLPITVSLPPAERTAFVDVVTGATFDATSGMLTFEPDAFGVHVLVPAASPCAK